MPNVRTLWHLPIFELNCGVNTLKTLFFATPKCPQYNGTSRKGPLNRQNNPKGKKQIRPLAEDGNLPAAASAPHHQVPSAPSQILEAPRRQRLARLPACSASTGINATGQRPNK